MVLRYGYHIALIASFFLFGNCGNGVLEPGDVARPLAGTYRLESRTFVDQDSAGTILEVWAPPKVRSLLVLSREGRYGLVDTTATDNEVLVVRETGRWSVFVDLFYIESDDDRAATEQFRYDGMRLVRILPNQSGGPSGLFSIVDVWVQLTRG